MKPSPILLTIIAAFSENANPDLAVGMKAYMKGKFEYFGIKSPLRKEISKPVLQNCKSLSKAETINLAKQLWNEPQRELHYISMELLFQNLKKVLVKEDIESLEWFITKNSWWDTVDFIAPKLMAAYFQKFPDEAILFQLKYKKDTDLDLLFGIILRVNHTKEFFINKAIGWILRENAKRIPIVIYDFIRNHQHELSNLSIREGLKHSTTEQLKL